MAGVVGSSFCESHPYVARGLLFLAFAAVGAGSGYGLSVSPLSSTSLIVGAVAGGGVGLACIYLDSKKHKIGIALSLFFILAICTARGSPGFHTFTLLSAAGASLSLLGLLWLFARSFPAAPPSPAPLLQYTLPRGGPTMGSLVGVYGPQGKHTQTGQSFDPTPATGGHTLGGGSDHHAPPSSMSASSSSSSGAQNVDLNRGVVSEKNIQELLADTYADSNMNGVVAPITSAELSKAIRTYNLGHSKEAPIARTASVDRDILEELAETIFRHRHPDKMRAHKTDH